MDDFKFIYEHEPIDFFEGSLSVSNEEELRVLTQMPEESRDSRVYKTYIPYGCMLVPIYMCKADNNGTTYIFTDYNIYDIYKNIFEYKGE